jgi:hypothetical protein
VHCEFVTRQILTSAAVYDAQRHGDASTLVNRNVGLQSDLNVMDVAHHPRNRRKMQSR